VHTQPSRSSLATISRLLVAGFTAYSTIIGGNYIAKAENAQNNAHISGSRSARTTGWARRIVLAPVLRGDYKARQADRASLTLRSAGASVKTQPSAKDILR
jgi:hypothetical protein